MRPKPLTAWQTVYQAARVRGASILNKNYSLLVPTSNHVSYMGENNPENNPNNAFPITNGVRQGGILSPFLFNLYMDGLSRELEVCKTVWWGISLLII